MTPPETWWILPRRTFLGVKVIDVLRGGKVMDTVIHGSSFIRWRFLPTWFPLNIGIDISPSGQDHCLLLLRKFISQQNSRETIWPGSTLGMKVPCAYGR